LALCLALSATFAPGAEPAAPADEPRLVVMIVVDGLSWRRLDAYRPWYTAGLKTLLDEGTVMTEARFRHLNTETGPGHASLGAGAPPRVHGIVANLWLERTADGSMRRVYCTDQPAYPNPGSPPMFYREIERDGRVHAFALSHELARWEASGELSSAVIRTGYGPSGETVVFDSEDAIFLYNFRHGRPAEPWRRGTVAGPANLRVPTFGDRLVEQRPGARVFSLSAKDRGSVFMAGRDRHHVVYWYDQDTGRFVTSAAFDTAAPVGAAAHKVVTAFNRDRTGAQLPGRFGLSWPRLAVPPPPRPLPTPVPDLAAFQLPAVGGGFPHDLTAYRTGYFSGLYHSPLTDELLADLALALLDAPALRIGQGGQPDLLALSFSAQDPVAHSYGPESEENLDVLRRLDLQIGRVLRALEQRVGAGRFAVAFSADHGMNEIPEAVARRERTAAAARLLDGVGGEADDLARLNLFLTDELCLPADSAPVRAFETFSLYYDRSKLPLRTVAGRCGPAGREVGAAEIDAVLPRAVAAVLEDEIETVLLASQHDRWSPADPRTEFARNGFDAERSGDAFLFPRPGVLAHWDVARGTGHGSHHDPDTHVPLIFWGPAFRAGTDAAPATPYDLVPTLASLVGVRIPDATGVSRLAR
jgi:predicted AlkP superfamily pyrophosphatase or phosphodiesterase